MPRDDPMRHPPVGGMYDLIFLTHPWTPRIVPLSVSFKLATYRREIQPRPFSYSLYHLLSHQT